jgi:hypothetical protein
MIKRDELANPNSCLNKAADNEPIFVLRANDDIAAYVVREWAYRYYQDKRSNPGGVTDPQKAKFDEALELADTMERWQRERA